MNQISIIEKKRDGQELSESEITFLIEGYVADEIPDYQISAFLMAVYFQGMSAREAAVLTRLMRDSGVVLRHAGIPGPKVDKHSTGGVGDKVSLVLAPLVASAGLYVPMISGRALAHTGGTLDKLESIPGFRTNLSMPELGKILLETGAVLVGQNAELTPADKKMYALRDATATVNSIPLITASILSKKMAEGIDALVLDVKAGSGAIFKDQETAWQLAQMLVDTATEFGLKTTAIVTAMDQPLGNTIGNWLETREAIETLQGGGPEDFKNLTLILSAQMLVLSKAVQTLAEGIEFLEKKLNSGAAFQKFIEIVRQQGGDVSVVERPASYAEPKYKLEINAELDGYVSKMVSRELGIASMALGAGRHSMNDEIDYISGLVLHKKVGDKVSSGDTLLSAYSNAEDLLQQNEQRIRAAVEVVPEVVSRPALIYGAITPEGRKSWNPESQDFI